MIKSRSNGKEVEHFWDGSQSPMLFELPSDSTIEITFADKSFAPVHERGFRVTNRDQAPTAIQFATVQDWNRGMFNSKVWSDAHLGRSNLLYRKNEAVPIPGTTFEVQQFLISSPSHCISTVLLWDS
jgi:hypothetical protein